MKKILVPCDFSPTAIEAFKFAVEIAWETKGEVHVLYVIDLTFLNGTPTLDNCYAFSLNFLKKIEDEVSGKFQDLRDRYAPRTLPVKFTHQIDSLINGIQTYIRKNEIDLVLMGTQAISSQNSNADRVVRKTDIPVLVIHQAPQRNIRNIVVPVIPDQYDPKLIQELKNLQRFFKAQLHLLWINTPLVFKTDDEAEIQVQELARDFKLDEYSVNIRSDYTVGNGILSFAKEINADMIAMGTHGWAGIAHLLAGSVSEDVVDRTEVPVWTYRMR